MGVRLTWSFAAQRDLDDLESYIAADNPATAHSFARELVRRVSRLQEFPEMGSVVPEFRDLSLRQVVHGSYRVIYRFHISQREIEIARVWHSARGVPDLRNLP